MLFIMLVLNFVISWFNAWATGKVWAESKHQGGWSRVMAWSGAIMSACGFTWCYLIVMALVGTAIPVGHPAAGAEQAFAVTPEMFEMMLKLGYVVIILPILGSGLAILINSWAHFYRERTFGSGGIAAWNTFAQISNTMQAVSLLPGFLGDLGGFFKKGTDSKKDGLAVFIVVLLVCIALGGGILTTRAILLASARSHVRDLAFDREMASARAT